MAQINPHACMWHDWNGFGRCPYCREERYAAMERRHELELLEDPIPESGIVQPEREHFDGGEGS